MRKAIGFMIVVLAVYLGGAYLNQHPELWKTPVEKALNQVDTLAPKDYWKDAKPDPHTCKMDVPAYDRAAPHNQIGTFKKGTTIVIEPIPWIDDMFPVRYDTPDGKTILAVVKPFDLGYTGGFTVPGNATPAQIDAIAQEEMKKHMGR